MPRSLKQSRPLAYREVCGNRDLQVGGRLPLFAGSVTVPLFLLH
jgi:hypothetical protein